MNASNTFMVVCLWTVRVDINVPKRNASVIAETRCRKCALNCVTNDRLQCKQRSHEGRLWGRVRMLGYSFRIRISLSGCEYRARNAKGRRTLQPEHQFSVRFRVSGIQFVHSERRESHQQKGKCLPKAKQKENPLGREKRSKKTFVPIVSGRAAPISFKLPICRDKQHSHCDVFVVAVVDPAAGRQSASMSHSS